MRIDLSSDEMTVLKGALDRALLEMERELVRTDAPDLQHALAADVEHLRSVRERLEEESGQAWAGDGDAVPPLH